MVFRSKILQMRVLNHQNLLYFVAISLTSFSVIYTHTVLVFQCSLFSVCVRICCHHYETSQKKATATRNIITCHLLSCHCVSSLSLACCSHAVCVESICRSSQPPFIAIYSPATMCSLNYLLCLIFMGTVILLCYWLTLALPL